VLEKVRDGAYASWRMPVVARMRGESPTLLRMVDAVLPVLWFAKSCIVMALATMRIAQRSWRYVQPRSPSFPCFQRMKITGWMKMRLMTRVAIAKDLVPVGTATVESIENNK
jgi:hypothetical protein